MKAKALVLSLILLFVLSVGCSRQSEPPPSPTPPPAAPAAPNQPDATTSASIVDTNEAFKKAIGKDGAWIIATLKDLSFTEDLVLEGEFTNGKKDDKGNDQIQRKIALYAQDADHKVTERYTLTTPKLTVKSPNGRIQGGILKGDLIVDVADFQLVDQKVEGNVFFTKQEYKDSFKVDEKSSVTGKQEIQK